VIKKPCERGHSPRWAAEPEIIIIIIIIIKEDRKKEDWKEIKAEDSVSLLDPSDMLQILQH
jgi:hypothetical protein